LEKLYQKILTFTLLLGLNFVFLVQLNAQSCYVRLFDASDIEPNQFQLTASLGDLCDSSTGLSLHYYNTSTNTDYRELNQAFATVPAWLWPIIREIGIELVIELLKKQDSKVVQLPANIIEALRAIQQGDLYEFLD
jgi:hypothetical protein